MTFSKIPSAQGFSRELKGGTALKAGQTIELVIGKGSVVTAPGDCSCQGLGLVQPTGQKLAAVTGPAAKRWHLKLGIAFFFQGRTRDAAENLRQADGALASFYLGRALASLQEYDKALETLAAAAEKQPNAAALEAERMRAGQWPCTLSHRIRGSTLGIFGLGHIGSLVAEGGRGLGMKVLVWGQKNSLEKAVAAGYEAAKSKAELFERSDVLSISVRLRPETRGLVGPDDLARMKPTALFVNVARAELVAPGALLAALQKGRPGYAAMDVYEEEPVTGGNHPFLKMDNVLCTPHLGWAEWDNFELYFSECFEQIVAFEHGREMRLINPTVKARK